MLEPMMLYLTGSASFNKYQRFEALQKGLVLSQLGLRNRETNELVGEQTERGIFETLKMQFLEPKDREADLHFVKSS